MKKIRTGDQVIVITGRDKGKQGRVLARASEEKIIVEGVNLVKKHQKPNPAKNLSGGIVEKGMPIHQSNVALLNPQTGKADKVKIQLTDGGVRIRVYRSTEQEVKVN
jgi:large subunit ribosomal protein L24